VRRRTVLLTAVVAILFAAIFPNAIYPTSAALVQREWLEYDDGTYEEEEAYPVGYMLGVRFSPPNKAVLTRVRFYIVRDPAAFEIHVLDASTYEDIMEPFMVTPSPEFVSGWLEVRLLIHRRFVLVEGDFIVALRFVSAEVPVLGSDIHGIDGGMSEIYDGTGWSTNPSNFMIRAQIMYIAL